MNRKVQRLMAALAWLSIMSMLLAACGGEAATSTTAPVASTPTTAMAADATSTTAMAAEPTATTAMAADPTATTATAADPTATTGGTASGDAMTLPDTCTTPVAIAYWNPFTGPDGPFMGQLVDQFNASQTDVAATMTTQSDYYVQLGTAQASDSLPDVAIVHADQVATWAYNNALQPIDDVATALDLSEDDFPAGPWGAGLVNGNRYSIPLDIHPMTMFYNNDLLTAAGLSGPPTTGAEFEAAATAMTGNGNNGFLLTGGFPAQQIFSMLLHQYGGTWFNEDGTEAAWNSDAGVQALTWMKDAQTKYGLPNLEVDAELNAFKTGTVGMIWNGIWQTTNVTGSGVSFAGKGYAVPQIGPNPAVWAGSHQLTLPKHNTMDECKRAGGAMLINYLVENSAVWASAGQVPANNTVRESAEVEALDPIGMIAPSVENAIFPPSVPGITDAFGPLDEAVNGIMAGTLPDIKAALDDAKTRADAILEQNRGKYTTPPTVP